MISLIKVNPTHFLLLESLKDPPIGETDHFLWYVTDIGIAALFKDDENLKAYDIYVEKEAKNISLDISKEEKEYCEIQDKKIFLFYS